VARNILYTTLFFLIPFSQKAQTNNSMIQKDSLLKIPVPLNTSFISLNDTTVHAANASQNLNSNINPLPGLKNQIFNKNPNSHFFRLIEGNISYNYEYRSIIDTPFAEKNISQHQQFTSILVGIGNLPIRINSFIRKSNSALFKDIVDFQVQFDGIQYSNKIKEQFFNQLSKKITETKDSLSQKLYEEKLAQLIKLKNWISDPHLQQRLIEANEILNVPAITYDLNLPDSTNAVKADSLKRLANAFIAAYSEAKWKYDALHRQVDSLKMIYEKFVQRINQLERLVQEHRLADDISYKDLYHKSSNAIDSLPGFMPKYKWIYGIRNIGLGRNVINTSELTAKNISINGINFEYNSWYYLSLAAGIVDYRFRDFALNRVNRSPQYLYMLRLGVGNTDRNYIILSAFKGQKQLFQTTNQSDKSGIITISGLTAEAKWQVNKSTYIISEIGQSFSPDIKTVPVQKNQWDIRDKTNKALYLKVYSYITRTATRIEGRYKFTGSNYQAFNSFQTNAELRSWYLKANQSFFNKKLKLLLAISKNDFQNPYVLQSYKNNTTFKTFNTTLQIKKWPVVTFSYMPTSQLTIVDSQIQENRFQTLNASISHTYRAGEMRGIVNLIYTKFFNNSTDSGYIYYNSNNLFLGQSFLFKKFSVDVAISNSKNENYSYTVMDGNIKLPVFKNVSINAGVKINKLNDVGIKVGQYIDSEFTFLSKTQLSFRIERSFLPGNSQKSLLPIIWGNVNVSRTL
jgi:hypothetical protein